MKTISFVIPCYGSEKTIEPVCEEIINEISKRNEYDYEILAVNDCSPDNVLGILKTMARNNEKIKVLNLAKNMNRPGAVMAGLNYAKGDYIVIMDDDGQCPMNQFWELFKPIEDGHDVSIASYKKRKQSLFKNFGTFVNDRMTRFIINKPKDMQVTNFIICKSYVIDEIIKYDNPYPYFTGLLLRTTTDIVNVELEQRERFEGKSTFTFFKMLSMWINGLTAFSVRPLRISSFIGALSAFAGFIFGVVTIIRKFTANIALGWSSIVSILLFIGGLIMLMLGMIGEYLGRIYISLNKSPQYVIKEKINIKEN